MTGFIFGFAIGCLLVVLSSMVWWTACRDWQHAAESYQRAGESWKNTAESYRRLWRNERDS